MRVIAASKDSQLLWINSQARELLRVGHIPLDKLKLVISPGRPCQKVAPRELRYWIFLPMVLPGLEVIRREETVGSMNLQDVRSKAPEEYASKFSANDHELRT